MHARRSKDAHVLRESLHDVLPQREISFDSFLYVRVQVQRPLEFHPGLTLLSGAPILWFEGRGRMCLEEVVLRSAEGRGF
jgi:hypothetical protein